MGWFERFKARVRGEEPTSRLVEKGMRVGKNFIRGSGVILDSAHCWLIEMGDDVRLAAGVHILAHDAAPKKELGYTKIGRVRIGNNVGIGVRTVVLPNVTIGDNVIIGAMSLVTKDVPSNSVMGGNPLHYICSYEEMFDKVKTQMEARPVWDEKWTLRGGITSEMKQEMLLALDDGIGFVE